MAKHVAFRDLTPDEFMSELRLRDVIEFYDVKYDKENKCDVVDETTTYVDRISSLHVLTYPDKIEFNIWTDIFPEMASRGDITPYLITRILEQGREPNRPLPTPAHKIGDRIIFKDDKELVDTISGIEQAIYDDGQNVVRYTVKTYGYQIESEDIIEVLIPKVEK